jgi:hypothetical protein
MRRRILASVAICGLALFGLQLGGVATARTHAQMYGAGPTVTGSCTVSGAGEVSCTFTWSGFGPNSSVGGAVDGNGEFGGFPGPSGTVTLDLGQLSCTPGPFGANGIGVGDHTISVTDANPPPATTSSIFTITGCGATLTAAFTG